VQDGSRGGQLDTLQPGFQGWVCLLAMQQQGQLVLLREPQLPIQQPQLPLQGCPGRGRTVQPALAHGAGHPLAQEGIEPLEVDVVQGLGELR
jgi:hypothetical protein